MIPGKATPEGTATFAKNHASLHANHWKSSLGLTISSLGLGTYLGNADPVTDGKYAATAQKALEQGINVIDSAINYRFQRSERNVGEGIKKAIESGAVSRDQILLCTKGGFIAGDMGPPTREWAEETLLNPGILAPEDVVAGAHCMTPKYLKHQVDQSRSNLGVETIDVYYVHNPETQLTAVVPEDYYARLTEAFRALEECVSQGKIQWYGTATWQAYRVPDADPSFVSLTRTVACAEAAGGKEHHFRVIQFPYNPAMPEAYKAETQDKGEEGVPALKRATELGLTVFTSVPLMQTQIIGQFSPKFRENFPGLKTDAQRCLQFARSTPGICAPLCGMKDLEHLEENLKVATVPTITGETLESLFGQA